MEHFVSFVAKLEPETFTVKPNEPELGSKETDGPMDMFVVCADFDTLDVVKEVEELVVDVEEEVE